MAATRMGRHSRLHLRLLGAALVGPGRSLAGSHDGAAVLPMRQGCGSSCCGRLIAKDRRLPRSRLDASTATTTTKLSAVAACAVEHPERQWIAQTLRPADEQLPPVQCPTSSTPLESAAAAARLQAIAAYLQRHRHDLRQRILVPAAAGSPELSMCQGEDSGWRLFRGGGSVLASCGTE